MKPKTMSLFPSTPQRPNKLIKISLEVILAILIMIWLYTSISKLADFEGLKIQMLQSPVFHKYSTLAAIVGPGLEITIAILLVIERTRVLGLISSFFLLVFFTWYVAYLMLTMPNLPCSCGGVVSFLNWPQHLVLNIFLTIISFTGIILQRQITKFSKVNSSQIVL